MASSDVSGFGKRSLRPRKLNFGFMSPIAVTTRFGLDRDSILREACGEILKRLRDPLGAR